jgi:HK97 gp10 family phage protein
MADGFTMRVTGMEEAKSRVRAVAQAPSGPGGVAALRAAAEVIAQKMRENILAAGLVDSGAMLRSIRVHQDRRATGTGTTRVLAGTKLWYAKFSEYGTVRQPAIGWGRRAEDEGRLEAQAEYERVLNAELQRRTGTSTGRAA